MLQVTPPSLLPQTRRLAPSDDADDGAGYGSRGRRISSAVYETPGKPLKGQRTENQHLSPDTPLPRSIYHEEGNVGEAEREAAGSNHRTLNEEEPCSPAAVAKLHLAIEKLSTPNLENTGVRNKALDIGRCVEFCAEWSIDNLPASLDPSLLQPLWSVAEQQVGLETESRR